MKRIPLYICSLALAAFATSCGSVERAVRVEVLRPAKDPVPYAGKTPAIFNALHVARENGDGKIVYATDSMMVNLLAEGAKETLEASPLFDGYDVPIFNLTLFCHDTCPELYDTAYMASLAAQSQASLLLIIDHTATRLQKLGGTRGITFHITYAATYRFYDAEQQRYVATRPLHDSLTTKRLISDLSWENMQEIWRDVIRDAGRQALEPTIPLWETDYRWYYLPAVSDGQWYNASYYAYLGKWPEAMKIWGELAGSSTGKKAACAAFNMAVGAEMMGEYELALEWLDLAGPHVRSEKIDNYRKHIRQRMSDKEKLNEQLGY
jgi:hypothetical protein